MAVVAPDQLVLGVDLGGFRIELGGLLIGVREHDQAVHLFDAPAVLDKSSSEVIEQLLVGGSFAHHTEIARGADNSAAEVVMPDAIGHHARGERILRIGQPVRQRTAAAC